MSPDVIFAVANFAAIPVTFAAGLARRDPARRTEDAITAAGLAGYAIAGGALLGILTRPGAYTLDPSLLAADRSLYFPTLSVFNWTLARPALHAMMTGIYGALSLAVALAWIAEQSRELRRALLIAGSACFVCYALVPAIGPAWYDWTAGAARASVPENCFPSMHFSAALLIAANARRPRLRIIFSIYAALVGAATIMLGAHYLVDLLAAVPFCAGVQYAARHFPNLFFRNLFFAKEAPCEPVQRED